MIISVNWLKKYTNINLPINDLVNLIGTRLVEVESVESLAPKYKDVIIAKVISVQKMENSDHLSKVLIDDDAVVKDVERNEDGFVQVVCGAPNVKEGMLVAWLPPNSIVPSTYNSEEPFKLVAKQLLNVKSNGMIASARELDLYDEHEGILEIHSNEKAGSYFIDIFDLNDYLLDIENKSLTHRPDTFGVIGFAREVAGIQGVSFKTPEWLFNNKIKLNGNLPSPKVFIDNPEAAENYELVIVDGNFLNAETPNDIKSFLSRVGVRPVNAIVDATNYMMLISGQPLHAFDYDKLVALCGGEPEIHVRYAKDGETLITLEDKKLHLTENDIVIVANDHVVALAGAIGGKDTAVDSSTKSVAIESATFNMFNLRSTQMRHGIFSEAITRFTKGQPYQQNTPVLLATIALLNNWASVTNTSEVSIASGNRTEKYPVEVSANEISKILATSLSAKEIQEILEKVEFKVDIKGDNLIITAPWWRQDISIKEDIAEEVGRLCGYDNISLSLPLRDFKAVTPNSFDTFKQQIRKTLASAGGNETLTYSFTPSAIMKQAGQDITNAYKIVNSISPELEYYRLSLMPSLLKAANLNLKQGHNEFMLFEINKVHALSRGLAEDSVPIEGYNVAGVVYQKDTSAGTEYYRTKYILEFLLKKLNIKLNYVPLDSEENSLSMFAPFEPKRSAMLKDAETGDLIGVVGEYKKSVIKNFKLSGAIAGFEINLIKLFELYQGASKDNYQPISKYPSLERDLCFKVNKDINYVKIINSVNEVLNNNYKNIACQITPVDIYSAKEHEGAQEETKNITIRLKIQAHNKTLTNQEINNIINDITKNVSVKTDAILV